MENDVIYTTAKLEELILKGYECINDFRNELSSFFYKKLEESTINGKVRNKRLKERLTDIHLVNISLEKYLGDNNVDVENLVSFITEINLGFPQTLFLIKEVFKSSKYDDEDKELTHKNITIYDEFVTKYESLLLKIACKNIELRTAKNQNLLNLEKISDRKEIEKLIKDYYEKSKR